jgi:hypothetical protein
MKQKQHVKSSGQHQSDLDSGQRFFAILHEYLCYPLLLSIAVNFIPNKQSPALSSLVDCPMLFGIDGLQECSLELEAIAGGWHCFCDYGCGKVPSHTITSFAVCLLFTAVNFIPNEQSPALSSSVDCPTLFGIDSLQSAASNAVLSLNRWRTALLSLLWLREGAFTHYHIFCDLSFLLL